MNQRLDRHHEQSGGERPQGEADQVTVLHDHKRDADARQGGVRKHVAHERSAAQQYMDRGDLVPDDVIIGMIKSRLQDGAGMVLDGFPRTVVQAQALDEALDEAGMPLDRVFYFDVPGQELVKRLTNRASEQGRADDRPEAIERRMQVYEEQTAPVLAYYRESGRVTDIRGTGSPDEVFDRLVAASS